MQNYMKTEERKNNLVDFHIHGIGSYYKDSFATANYDQICAYFQKIADEKNANFCIAITEHDSSLITFEQYKTLKEKYPNVKLVLGMETNCNLRTVTDDIFDRAHVLTYADMSNDESIKKWLECKELKDLSKINTFQLPCNYQYVKDYCTALNILFQLDLDVDKYAKMFENLRFSKDTIKERLIDVIVDDISKNKPKYFDDCQNKNQIKTKLLGLNVSRIHGEMKTALLGLKPSIYRRSTTTENLKLALKRYNEVFGDNFQFEKLKRKIYFQYDSHETLDEKFIKIISKRIAKNDAYVKKIGVGDDYIDIEDYINKKIWKYNKGPFLNYNQYFETYPKIDNLGQKFYIAKSVLNKHIGINITNDALARILDYSKPRDVMRNEFVYYVRKLIEYKNPTIYEKTKNLTNEEFCEYKFGENKHGKITINNLVSKNQYEQNFQSTDFRTKLEELNTIVKKTGARLVLAHPNSNFDYRKDEKIEAKNLKGFDGNILTENTKRILIEKCRANQSIKVSELSNIENSKLFKLDLFFKLCERKDIKFDGFEISKSDIESPIFLNSLIFATKHNLDISFGSDTHLSNLHHYYNLLQEGKIDQSTFDKLREHAYVLRDNTAQVKGYLKKYSNLFVITGGNKNSKLLNNPIIKSQNRVYPKKVGYEVSKTSLCDKILNNKESNKDVMIGLKINNDYYEFDKETLKNMNYKISGSNFNIQNSNNENLEE